MITASDCYRAALDNHLKEHKITQTDLADKMGVVARDVNGFIRGKRAWSEQRQMESCGILGVDYIEMLLRGRELITDEPSIIYCDRRTTKEDTSDVGEWQQVITGLIELLAEKDRQIAAKDQEIRQLQAEVKECLGELSALRLEMSGRRAVSNNNV